MIGIWVFMLLMDLLIPFTMIGLGRSFIRKAPKNINAVFGYRTTMSMKNRDTWNFAHQYCGKLWLWLGSVLAPLSVVPLLFVLGKEITTIAAVGTVVCLIQIIPLVGSIIPTEIALKKTFDQNGKRKKGS